MSRLESLGAAPELRTHPGHKFLVTVSHRSLVPTEVVESIASWLEAGYPLGGRARQNGSFRPAAGAVGGATARVRRSRQPLRHPDAGQPRPGSVRQATDRSVQCGLRQPGRPSSDVRHDGAPLGAARLRRSAGRSLGHRGQSRRSPERRRTSPIRPAGLEDLREAVQAAGSGPRHHRGPVLGRRLRVPARCARSRRRGRVAPQSAHVLRPGAGARSSRARHRQPRWTTCLGRCAAMAERGVDTLLVVSRNDPGVAYVDAHAGDAMRALAGVPRFHRVDIDGADHSFTPVTLQERVSDLLTERLAALSPGMTISAFAALAAKEPLVPVHVRARAPRPADVEIEISHCGICHSDLHLIDNDWSTSTYPLVPGHEIVGTVAAAGAQATPRGRAARGHRLAALGLPRLRPVPRRPREPLRPPAGDLRRPHGRLRATASGPTGASRSRSRRRSTPQRPRPSSAAAPRCSRPSGAGASARARASASSGSAGSGTSRSASCARWAARRRRSRRRPTSATRRSGSAPPTRPRRPRRARSARTRVASTSSSARCRRGSTGSRTCRRSSRTASSASSARRPASCRSPPRCSSRASASICGSDIGSPAAIREMLAFAAEHGIGAQVETAPMADVNAALQRVRENRVRYRMVLAN